MLLKIMNILWMDADAVFTNQRIKIEDKISEYPEKDYYLCRDPKHILLIQVYLYGKTQ